MSKEREALKPLDALEHLDQREYLYAPYGVRNRETGDIVEYTEETVKEDFDTIRAALTEHEQIKARAEEVIKVVAKNGTSLLSTLPMTPVLFVNTIKYIINGDSKC